jgi:hypothetical protein
MGRSLVGLSPLPVEPVSQDGDLHQAPTGGCDSERAIRALSTTKECTTNPPVEQVSRFETVAGRLLAVVWHVLTRSTLDHHSVQRTVAFKLVLWGRRLREDGHESLTRPQFVRTGLMKLRMGGVADSHRTMGYREGHRCPRGGSRHHRSRQLAPKPPTALIPASAGGVNLTCQLIGGHPPPYAPLLVRIRARFTLACGADVKKPFITSHVSCSSQSAHVARLRC